MLRALGVLFAAAALAASAGAAPPRVITRADSGKTFTVRRGAHLILRLAHAGGLVWSEATVRGRAIDVDRVEFFRDPGYDEWAITARARGRATVTVSGRHACTTSRCPPLPAPVRFTVRIVVLPRP